MLARARRSYDSLAEGLVPVARWWHRAFSIAEIEHSVLLKWFFGAMLFDFFVSFTQWMTNDVVTIETYKSGHALCWPFFPNCGEYYFLHWLPYGWSQTTFYMGLYAVMLLCVYLVWRKRWTQAHMVLTVLWLWKAFVLFAFTFNLPGGYNYHHVFLTFVLLFLPYKEFFLRVTFISLYFISTVVKFDESWILGTYFTSLQAGMPFVPNAIVPFLTNFVIFMEVIGGWFLLSPNRYLQRAVLIFFAAFHLYSGVLVGYAYPAIAFTSLIILFGPLYRPLPPPLTKKSLVSWAFIGFLIAFCLPGPLIPGDQRLTLEGNHFGLNVFDSNHQCIETYEIFRKPGSPTSKDFQLGGTQTCSGLICQIYSKTYQKDGFQVTEKRWESSASWQRCGPSVYVQPLQSLCKNDPTVDHIALQFDHSINGGPFYRIVDAQNVCGLTYHYFSHNDWIKYPPEAQIVGYPVKNVFRYAGQTITPDPTRTYATSTIPLHELWGNDPATLTPLQTTLDTHLGTLEKFWSALWALTLAVLLALLIRRAIKK